MSAGSFVHNFKIEGAWYPAFDDKPHLQDQRVALAFALKDTSGRYEVFFSRTGHNIGIAEARSLTAAWKLAVKWVERAALPPGVSR